MFEDLMRELRALEQTTSVSMTINTDDHGYFDRVCPGSSCGVRFKVHYDDWLAKVPNEKAWCPFCGTSEEPSKFDPPELTAYVERVVLAEVDKRLAAGLHASARTFNRKQRPGLVTVTMEVDAGPPVPKPMPPAAWDEMRLEIACHLCGCRFAVVGAGFFCPACGANSAEHTFGQSVERVRTNLTTLENLVDKLEADVAAQLRIQLVEGGMPSLVTAFQRYAEAQYEKLPLRAARPRRNAFQSLQEGSALWSAAGGRSFSLVIAASEMAELVIFFQQRHVIEHREGIVDQDYVSRSGDSRYRVGQRLVIHPSAVRRAAELIEKLGLALRADLP